MKLSVIVPCYNEEENVCLFYKEFVRVFKHFKYEYELVFVNDGSKDKTWEKLQELCINSKENIKIINFSRNFGKEAAMYAGLKEASGDFFSLIDADLQQRPEVLLEMFDILDSNDEYDCVAAYQKVRNEGTILKFFKDCFYKLINKISDVNFIQGASDFRVFRKCVRDAIIEIGERQRFTKGIFSFVGFNTYFMSYKAEERVNGVSKWSFVSLFKYAISGIVSFSTFPLKLPVFLGVLLVLIALIFLIIGLIFEISLVIVMLFFLLIFLSGLQFIVIWVVGQYIAMIYGEVKQRPIYIVRDILTSDEKKKVSKKK